MQQHEIPYTVALDLDRSVARAFGNIRATPTSFLVAADGRIALQHTGMLDMEELQDRIAELLIAAPG